MYASVPTPTCMHAPTQSLCATFENPRYDICCLTHFACPATYVLVSMDPAQVLEGRGAACVCNMSHLASCFLPCFLPYCPLHRAAGDLPCCRLHWRCHQGGPEVEQCQSPDLLAAVVALCIVPAIGDLGGCACWGRLGCARWESTIHFCAGGKCSSGNDWVMGTSASISLAASSTSSLPDRRARMSRVHST